MQRWLAGRPYCIPLRRLASHGKRLPITLLPHPRSLTLPHGAATASNPSPEHLSLDDPNDGSVLQARSLLRALLRECSYLPDSFVRQRVKEQIRDSFRSYDIRLLHPHISSAAQERLAKKLRDGRRALSQLQRAAGGDQWRLQRVLFMAYGRIGKRRRELLKPLLPLSRPQELRMRSQIQKEGSHSQDEAQAEAFSGPNIRASGRAIPHPTYHPTAPPISKYQPHTLPPQLSSLLQSQIQYGPPPLTRSNPRRLQAIVPELNTWLRPMPQKRVKNIRKKHYADLLDRALPPLPPHEWNQLRDLACGQTKVELPKQRRRVAVSNSTHEANISGALDMVVRCGTIPHRFSKQHPVGAMNARTMRRLYAKVFSQCPLMRYDEDQKKWLVAWGEQAMLDKGMRVEE